MEGELLGIKDGSATILVDGYACSNTIPLQDIVRAWKE